MTTWSPVYIAGCASRIRSPAHSFGGAAATSQSAMSFGGVMPWPQALYLREVMANPERNGDTIGTATGVLERIDFDPADPLLRSFSGWYVLSSFDISADHKWSINGLDYPVGFSLKASFLGAQREAVVVSSSRQLANDFGIVGVPTVVDPFPNEDPTGAGAWLTVDAGGSTVLLEYDDTAPMVSMGPNTEPLVP